MNKAVLFFLAILASAPSALAAQGGTYIEGNNSMTHLAPIPPQPPPKRIQVPRAKTSLTTERAAVVSFVNAHRPRGVVEIAPGDVVDFTKTDIGGGRSDLFVLFDFSGRGYSNRLWIYSRLGNGGLHIQHIEGWKMGPLRQMIRDLNGDGRDELIAPEELGPKGVWYPLMEMPTWPAVYRLSNGKYVEDSRDFPNYYDNEVLPSLDKAIAVANNRGYTDAAAIYELEKNKILRVLGRNPAAGLGQAYQWMNSSDPALMQCAIATFSDIGGHDQEVHQLRNALPSAIKHQLQARKGG